MHPAIRCARALRRLTADRGSNIHDVPEAILLLAFIAIPVARNPEFVSPVFGEFTRLITLGLLWFAPLTALGFVAAGSRVDAFDFAHEDQKPGAAIVTIIYHLGGGAGIAFARIVFKDSPAFKDSPGGVPKLLGAMAMIGVLVVFSRLQTIPTFQPTPHAPDATFTTFQPTK